MFKLLVVLMVFICLTEGTSTIQNDDDDDYDFFVSSII